MLCAAAVVLLSFQLDPAEAASQRKFKTPEAAVAALQSALDASDASQIVAIFGQNFQQLVETGEPDVDAARYAQSASMLKAYHVLDDVADDAKVLLIGPEAWPFPVPLVKERGSWRFASELGEDELLNRRIGRNELEAIGVLTAYLDAQQLYASVDRNGDRVKEYAGRLGSNPGQRDGLYWEAAQGEEISPFGPLVAESSINPETRNPGDPFHGYHFRILTKQGANAAGGAFDYVINGRLLAGFAMVAYPAEYGESGIMTFIVNQDGQIYQRDLGEQTESLGNAMSEFDPSAEWTAYTP